LTVENNNIALIPISELIIKTIRRVIPLRFDIHHPVSSRKRRYSIDELEALLEFKIILNPLSRASFTDGSWDMLSNTLPLFFFDNLTVAPNSILEF
tara:strand:+ start:2221 stop:2508 length:288 start_codon:yes stop_codon:yes gene_type:complete